MEVSRRIARQARRRIELVASRLPGKGAWKRAPVEEPPEADRVVVVSDTHLGDPFDVLSSERMVAALADTINGLGPIDELVLLGDIFDFWQAPISGALDRGRDLMAALFMLDNVRRIVYLPGNHDHHLFRMHYVEEMNKRLRAGNLEPPELSIPLGERVGVRGYLFRVSIQLSSSSPRDCKDLVTMLNSSLLLTEEERAVSSAGRAGDS